MFIPVLLGTAREGRQSEKVAAYVLARVQQYGPETQLIDVRDFSLSRTDNSKASEQALRFSETMKRADGLIIVSSEYNHGYPGELKLVLDQLYEEYRRKPLGICGVSGGGLGGARAVEQLRLIAIEFQMVPIRSAVYFSNVGNLFDAQENITDASYDGSMKTLLDELMWYAEALKNARDVSQKPPVNT